MNKFTTTVAMFMMTTGIVFAQETNHQPLGLGYVFVGDATHSMGPAAGFGGELTSSSGLGLGLELGATGFTRPGDIHYNSYTIGVGSADVMYHYFDKKTKRQIISPFVAGGYNTLFGHSSLSLGKNTSGFNLGGGVDLFASKHAGLRFDARYYGHGGSILKNAYPDLAEFSFVAFRVALTFR